MGPVLSIPGFGWASPKHQKVRITRGRSIQEIFDDKTCTDAQRGQGIQCVLRWAAIFACLPPDFIELFVKRMNHALHELPGNDLEFIMHGGKSNGRMLRVDIIEIDPFTSFQLHAHPNIEVIFVLQGSIYEYRKTFTDEEKVIFEVNEQVGPDLSRRKDNKFELRHTIAGMGIGNNDDNHNEDDLTGFLVNERGSIHLTFTQQDGAKLLVMWSGGHANIPIDQYPQRDNTIGFDPLPVEVQPYDKI